MAANMQKFAERESLSRPSNPSGRPYGTNFITWENLDRRSWTSSGFEERTFSSLGVRHFEGAFWGLRNANFDFFMVNQKSDVNYWLIVVAEMFSSWNSTECKMRAIGLQKKSAVKAHLLQSNHVWDTGTVIVLLCRVAFMFSLEVRSTGRFMIDGISVSTRGNSPRLGGERTAREHAEWGDADSIALHGSPCQTSELSPLSIYPPIGTLGTLNTHGLRGEGERVWEVGVSLSTVLSRWLERAKCAMDRLRGGEKREKSLLIPHEESMSIDQGARSLRGRLIVVYLSSVLMTIESMPIDQGANW